MYSCCVCVHVHVMFRKGTICRSALNTWINLDCCPGKQFVHAASACTLVLADYVYVLLGCKSCHVVLALWFMTQCRLMVVVAELLCVLYGGQCMQVFLCSSTGPLNKQCLQLAFANCSAIVTLVWCMQLQDMSAAHASYSKVARLEHSQPVKQNWCTAVRLFGTQQGMGCSGVQVQGCKHITLSLHLVVLQPGPMGALRLLLGMELLEYGQCMNQRPHILKPRWGCLHA